MTDDLKQRLRDLDRNGYQPHTGAIGNEAADRIEQLEANYASLSQAFDEMKALAEQRLHALKKAQAERDSFYMEYRIKCDEQTKALHIERDELKSALNRLYIACPTTLECRHFHHSKREQHSHIEPCGPAAEYLEALNQARAALAKGEK